MPASFSPQPAPVEPRAPTRRPAPPPPTSFAEVINLWSSANELAVVLDVEAVTVRAWRRRGIPARYWSAVAQAARVTSRPVDERLLAELAAVRRAHLHG